MTTQRLIFLTLAFTFAASSAMAAEVRSSSPSLKTGPRAVTSIESAAAAAPPSRASAAEADSVRSSADREAKQHAMLQKLLKERRASMGAAALAANAAIPLPHVPGLPVSKNGGPFGFKGLSNFDQAGVNQGFSVEPPDQALCVGNGFIFEGVNDAFAVYDEHGRLIAGPAQANAFFGVPFELNVSDPRNRPWTRTRKRLIAMGYKPEMRNGERVFCRREEVLGSRLSVKKLCGTPKDLKAAQTAYREELEGQQHVQINPDPRGTKGH